MGLYRDYTSRNVGVIYHPVKENLMDKCMEKHMGCLELLSINKEIPKSTFDHNHMTLFTVSLSWD